MVMNIGIYTVGLVGELDQSMYQIDVYFVIYCRISKRFPSREYTIFFQIALSDDTCRGHIFY